MIVKARAHAFPAHTWTKSALHSRMLCTCLASSARRATYPAQKEPTTVTARQRGTFRVHGAHTRRAAPKALTPPRAVRPALRVRPESGPTRRPTLMAARAQRPGLCRMLIRRSTSTAARALMRALLAAPRAQPARQLLGVRNKGRGGGYAVAGGFCGCC